MAQNNITEQLAQIEKLVGVIVAFGTMISGTFAVLIFVMRSKFATKVEFDAETKMLAQRINDSMLGHERNQAQLELMKSENKRFEASLDHLNKTMEHTNNNIKEYSNKTAILTEKFMALEDRLDRNEAALLKQGQAIEKMQHHVYDTASDVKTILALMEQKTPRRRNT